MSAWLVDLFIRLFFITYKGLAPIVVAEVRRLVLEYGERSDLSGKEKFNGVVADLFAGDGELREALSYVGMGIINYLIETLKERYFPSTVR